MDFCVEPDRAAAAISVGLLGLFGKGKHTEELYAAAL
jgi:hypothetical protein